MNLKMIFVIPLTLAALIMGLVKLFPETPPSQKNAITISLNSAQAPLHK